MSSQKKNCYHCERESITVCYYCHLPFCEECYSYPCPKDKTFKPAKPRNKQAYLTQIKVISIWVVLIIGVILIFIVCSPDNPFNPFVVPTVVVMLIIRYIFLVIQNLSIKNYERQLKERKKTEKIIIPLR